jgi:hypothetical protein
MRVGNAFVLMFFTPMPFVYETAYGGAERADVGRSALRFGTLAQALAIGRKLQCTAPEGFSYTVYKMGDGVMELKGAYPKRVNAEGARIKFRRRQPRTGGADDARLGVGGMGDDIWRELLERDGWGSLDDAWREFRKELELGRGIEAVDEQGNPVDLGGDYSDDEEDVFD